MSKLIAFRLPDDLRVAFEAKCAAEKLTTTAAIVMLVRRWTDGEGSVALPPEPTSPRSFSHGRSKTVVASPKRHRIDAPAKVVRGFDMAGNPIYR